MMSAVRTLVIAIVATGVAAVALAQAPAPESFSGTATLKKGGATLTAPITVTVSRWATEADFATLKKAATAGSAALKTALSAMPECGSIQIGERSTPLKYAGNRSTGGSGRLVTVLTSEPIAHMGAGMPQAKPMAGFDLAIAMLVVGGGEGAGTGELAPGAKVGLDKDGAITIEDYGHTVVWLSGVASKTKGTR